MLQRFRPTNVQACDPAPGLAQSGQRLRLKYTGSNSVNVFLGLGLPWIIGACYYASKGEPFIAPAGSLSFSVTIYMCTSVVCFVLLYIKRAWCGGELGGTGFMRTGVALILTILWLFYIVISSLEAVGHIKSF